MEITLLHLQQQVRQLRLLLWLCLGGLSVLASLFAVYWQQQGQLIRTRGIAIADSSGRDRILIGAPLPASPHRVRLDSTLVRQHWARLGADSNEYMQWYRDYRHSANGLLVMNADGFDKVLLGDQLPDPNTGRRLYEPTGLLWNDDRGFERGGLGTNKTADGQYRTVLGLDDADGEALHLFTLEDGSKALRIAGSRGYLLVGLSAKKSGLLQTDTAFAGLRYFSPQGKLLWQQSVPLQ